MDTKNRIVKSADKHAGIAQVAQNRQPKGIVSTQVLGALVAMAEEVDRQDRKITMLSEKIDFILSEMYESEFESIDGLRQHPYGDTFVEWKEKRKIT